MNKRTFLIIVCTIICTGFVLSQESKDSVKEESIYPQFNQFFTAQESWTIHREAYEKQLKSKGLSKKEINRLLKEYEDQKEKIIAEIKAQMKMAEARKKEAEEQRKQFQIQREAAREQREIAQKQRKMAQIERERAILMRKLAEAQRDEAERQQRMLEERRSRMKKLMDKEITLSGEYSKVKTLEVQVAEKHSLYFYVNANINSGSVLVEIFNPAGKKEGELSLEHRGEKNSGTDENTSGSLNKTINSPEIGVWIIKITPEKASGNIDVSAVQYLKSGSDE